MTILKNNHENESCRFKFFNIAFFAAVMWFWWLTLASHKLNWVFELWLHNYATWILYLSFFIFLWVVFSYIMKMFINFDDVREDFMHPVKSNFFPWIWKILLLFSIWFSSVDMNISKYFLIFWLIVQWFFTVIILKRWMLHEMQIKEMNPLWFLPIVWNLIAPIAWMPHWFEQLSWFFFSIWIMLFFVLFTIIMNRIIFHNPLAQKLIPTLFILVAPWSIWFLAYTTLNWWVLTDFWRVLYFFSLFMFVMILSKITVLSKVKFFMSWWAYSFPMAALTIATIQYFNLTWILFFQYLSFLFYWILVLIILWLLIRTIIWAKNKELCVEE